MSQVEPVKVGILIDYLESEDDTFQGDMIRAFELVAREYEESGLLDRPVELVVEAAQGLPKGNFENVRKAFYKLIDQGCVTIFGPWVSENALPLSEDVAAVGRVPILGVCATERMLGEWVFALPAGSMQEEPIIMAQVAWYDGCRTVGIAYEDSFIGQEYLAGARKACARVGLKITGEVAIPHVQGGHLEQLRELSEPRPDALFHVGFGLGLLGMNAELKELGWLPPRYTTTAFEFSSMTDTWRQELAGWIGMDQYDERNEVCREFLDRFEAMHGRRPEYYWPPLCYDVARMLLTAVATARPLTGRGVKEALEDLKMIPAATGAPGTRMRFGKFIRQGFVGSEFLVARRVLDDASAIVMHGTIEGLVR